jgi:DNA polymerase-3 subunit epsilon
MGEDMSFKWIGQSADGSTVTLRKLNASIKAAEYATPEWLRANDGLVRSCVVLDTETTGLNRTEDQIIEIGLVEVKFNSETGDALSAENVYTAFQDPGMPLSEEVKAITGITDEMVKGHSIDWSIVSNLIADADIVAAHNAAFDRPFIERHVPASSSKIWGCSLKQIDWSAKGYAIQKLEILGIYHGFFIDAHRALNDTKALSYLLSLKNESTGTTYLSELVRNAQRPSVRIVAARAPFESKDYLKSRRYTWDTGNKYWAKSIYKDELADEISWLEEVVYIGKFMGAVQEIPVCDNFKLYT